MSALAQCAPAKRATLRRGIAAFTLVEVMVSMTVLAIVAVAITQALLQINRRAAIARVMNAAKAEALSRIQQVSQVSYNPDANPQILPDLLTKNSITDIDLGNSTTGLGSVPGKAYWNVGTPFTSNPKIRSVQCIIKYKYLNKDLTYELNTYRSPD